jgi:hypothetical protein
VTKNSLYLRKVALFCSKERSNSKGKAYRAAPELISSRRSLLRAPFLRSYVTRGWRRLKGDRGDCNAVIDTVNPLATILFAPGPAWQLVQ